MIQHPVVLAIALAFATSTVLSGCDSTANLTEQEHIQRAKDFEDKGNPNASVVELKNALQKNPDSAQARLLLGQLYLKVGMGAEAEKELTQAVKLGVNRESVKLQLGEALLLMQEYKRVLDEIQPGEQTSKANLARILQLRADALLMMGKLKDACDLYQQSLDTDRNNPPTYWGMAQCAAGERNLAKAREWLDVALEIKDKQAKTWIYIGDLERLANNSESALTAYSKALEIEPNNLEALQNHASMSLSLGQLEPARKDVERAKKLAPNSIGTLYLQALLDFNLKKYPAARDSLQAVFKITNDHAPSVLLAGMTAHALGSYQQAETHLKRYLTRFPESKSAARALASTQIKQKQPDNALETLAPFLSSGVKDPYILALAGEAYLAKGQWAIATEYLEKAAAIDPKNPNIQTQLGYGHLAKGDARSAITELQAAAALDSTQYQADNLLVLTHLKRKEYDQALAAIELMEKKIPNSPHTHTMRGNAYLGKNDPTKARKSYEQALAIEPTFFPAAASLAQLDIRDKKPDAARKRFEAVLNADKNNLQAMMALAEMAAANKQEKEYVGWLEKAIKANPQAIPPRAALVRYYLSKNEPRKALTLATELANANPDNPSALNILGTTQLAANDRVGAISTFTKLTTKASRSPDAFLRLALAQIADKRMADARASLQTALKLKPDHLQSQDALIRLEVTENKHDAALQVARQIQNQRPDSSLGYSREADIQLALKRFPQAIKAYEQALEKGAGSKGLIKLFRANIIAGNAKAADKQLNDWLIKNPNDTAVRVFVAEYYMFNGRSKDAIAQYQAILRSSPNEIAALTNLANLYQRENDSRALATAEQALKLAPDHPAVQDTLGWILLEQNQAQRALQLLSKAYAKAPDVVSIRYHHAVALAKTGDKTRARKELEKLLADAPKFPDAEAARALLKNI